MDIELIAQVRAMSQGGRKTLEDEVTFKDD
jgi:hypothetical protein